ncbi:putative Ig domain-containing protein [Cellulomonas denverensis]|uniref:Uncharacterized protein n=1 Tax=Cellulomonas denverensis TaxID=264297 RepID=A0A7X6KXM8_9CELL|nr:putative Ig domain-containing protein [Cellulomonas denverensis]NKY24076.1 hypothetical protein [Cellulomonas denverensis]GIG26513.1 hypothetical protein Cde04nite_27570 [Cellulomonas denverensis]
MSLRRVAASTLAAALVVLPLGTAQALVTGWAALPGMPGLGAGFDAAVQVVLPLADGSGDLIVGGDFTSLNGDGSIPDHLVRLNADGSPDTDTGFNAALGTGLDARVRTGLLADDGQIVIGGDFTTMDGAATIPQRLVRLDPAGGVPDPAWVTALGSGLEGPVTDLAWEVTGDLLVVGDFAFLDGSRVPRGLIRLRADGSLDTALAASLAQGFSDRVDTVAALPDGDLLVGGVFQTLNLQNSIPARLARLNADGSPDRDTGFNAAVGSGVSGVVYTIATTADGGVILGGTFSAIDGDATPAGLLRVDGDGVRDTSTSFNATAATFGRAVVATVLVSADGGVLVGGNYSGAGVVPNSLVRFAPDGSLDDDVNDALGTGFNGSVSALAETSDGALLVGGAFTALNGDAGTPDDLTRITPVSLDIDESSLGIDATGSRTDPVGVALGPVTPGGVATPGLAVSFAVTGLPDGLSFDPATGRITGTPTTPGDYPVTVTATSPTGAGTLTDTSAFTWTVAAGQAPTVAGSPATGTVGTPFDFTPAVTGDPAPTVTAVARGPLPAGLTLDPATGRVSGTPTAAGTVTIDVTATNLHGTAERTVTITVQPAAVPGLTVRYPIRMAGQSQTAVGSGFVPGEPVQLVLTSSPVGLGTVIADQAGGFTLTFTVPADVAPGAHTVTATATSGTARAGFTVIAATVVPAPAGLAVTGTQVGVVVVSAAALVVAGAAILALRRRRR